MPPTSRPTRRTRYLWHFRLQRLEAEPVWDSILVAAGNLDLTVGGPSFERRRPADGAAADAAAGASAGAANRRAAYMIRGFSTSRDVDAQLPAGRSTWMTAAPLPGADPDRHRAAGPVHDEQRGDRSGLREVRRAAAEGIGRRPRVPPSTSATGSPSPARRRRRERDRRSAYLENDPARLKGFAWLLFNLDEFIYVR